MGYWQLNGTAVDSSIYGNNGTVVGATPVTDRFGTANMAMSFNGTGDYVNVGNPANLSITAAITVAAWIKPVASGNSQYRCILAKRDSGSDANYQFYLNNVAAVNGGKLSWYSNEQKISGYVPVMGVWIFVAATVSGKDLVIYADGVSVLSSQLTSNLVTDTGGFAIGRTGSHTGEYFSGAIDEVKVFNRVLSAAEILSMYNHEKGKFSVGKDGTAKAVEFVEDAALPVQMRSKKKNLMVKGQLKEQ